MIKNQKEKFVEREQSISKMSLLAMACNIFLLIGKLSIGFISKNQTMIADAINSAGDVMASILSYIGNKLAHLPGDRKHPYGHGKAEYVFSLIISVVLFYASISIFKEGLFSLFNHKTFYFNLYLPLMAVLTILVKSALYLHGRKVYKNHPSLLVFSILNDHRNDILLGGLTLISSISGFYGYYFVDGIGSMLISLWISSLAFEIFMGAYNVLTDSAIDHNLMVYYARKIDKIQGVDHVDFISSSPTGINYILIVKVSVDAYLSVYEGHKISKEIKRLLMEEKRVDDVVVHINPAQFHEYKLDY